MTCLPDIVDKGHDDQSSTMMTTSKSVGIVRRWRVRPRRNRFMIEQKLEKGTAADERGQGSKETRCGCEGLMRRKRGSSEKQISSYGKQSVFLHASVSM